MANKEKGEVSLGQKWTLRYSTNALCELEEASGMGAIELANSLADESSLKLKNLRHMLWAGLLENHPGIQAVQAGQIIDELGFGEVGDRIGEAFTLAFPSDDDAEEDQTEGKQKQAS